MNKQISLFDIVKLPQKEVQIVDGVNVLSLFDGMACGMLAFLAQGIKVKSYSAYEIDKYAVQTATHNFPDIVELGDVFNADFTKHKGVDFLIGGSPCTYWSIAQKAENRETTASGIGWELFSQYVRALKEARPKFFIYENNKSMSNAIYWSISDTFGFEPIMINSALVSAQNRQRYYWVGALNENGEYSKVNIEQPSDRGILLKDVLDNVAVGVSQRGRYISTQSRTKKAEGGTEQYYESRTDGKSNCITSVRKDCLVAVPINTKSGKSQTIKHQYHFTSLCNICCYKSTYGASGVAEPVGTTKDGKAFCCTSHYYKGFGKNPARALEKHKDSVVAEPVGTTKEEKAFAVTAYYSTGQNPEHSLNKHIGTMVAIPVEYDDNKPTKAKSSADGKTYQVYEVEGGQITIKGKSYPIKLKDGFYIIRKLTVSECKRLQTVPECYTFPVSDTQAYKMLGNGWTVEVIAHLISFCVKQRNED